MSVLLDIKSLKLRATYSTEVAGTTISDVVMNVAIDGPVAGAARAKSVELCDCPPRATGASCEVSAVIILLVLNMMSYVARSIHYLRHDVYFWATLKM